MAGDKGATSNLRTPIPAGVWITNPMKTPLSETFFETLVRGGFASILVPLQAHNIFIYIEIDQVLKMVKFLQQGRARWKETYRITQ